MVRTCPCHGHGRGSTPRRIVLISTHFVDGIKNPNYNIDMNIFVTDTDPVQSAQNLPDKHIVKMPLETCQMLAIIFSDWYYGVGQLHKRNGQPYATKNGAFRNHPCTQWAAANQHNLAWLITHGYALCAEYHSRYGKVHTCHAPIIEAELLYEKCFDDCIDDSWRRVTEFTRAMPEDIKFDTTIDTIEAYKRYLNTKPWLAHNYLLIITPMTTTPNKSDLPVYDFSTTPEQRANEQAAIDKAIKDAEAAMKAPAAKRQDAPAVAKMKAKKLVPAKAKGSKSGRVVGISADENKFLYKLLTTLDCDSIYADMIKENQAAYDKLLARYNKN
jgi:hypothetical protein